MDRLRVTLGGLTLDLSCTKILEDVVSGLIVVVVGSLVAALLTACYSKRRKKLEITLSVIDQYFSLYVEIGNVKSLLTSSKIVQALKGSNPLRRTGDWFNGVADMINSNIIDISLCNNVGILKEIGGFHDGISIAMKERRTDLKKCLADLEDKEKKEECLAKLEDMKKLENEWKKAWKNIVTVSANIDEGKYDTRRSAR